MLENIIDAIGTFFSLIIGDVQKKRKFKIVTITSVIVIVIAVIFTLYVLNGT